MLVIAGFFVAPAALKAEEEGHSHGKEIAVQGEILDLACFVPHDGQGEGHAACARKCLKEGQPMGLLATDGTVYLLFGDHDDTAAYNQAKELAGNKVEIKGEPSSKGSLKGITVHSVRAL